MYQRFKLRFPSHLLPLIEGVFRNEDYIVGCPTISNDFIITVEEVPIHAEVVVGKYHNIPLINRVKELIPDVVKNSVTFLDYNAANVCFLFCYHNEARNLEENLRLLEKKDILHFRRIASNLTLPRAKPLAGEVVFQIAFEDFDKIISEFSDIERYRLQFDWHETL